MPAGDVKHLSVCTAPRADHLFLSTHAVFDPADPYASSFVLGDGKGERLSLASLLAGALRLKPGVAIYANACETATLDPRLAAEEHLGFSAALFASGARFVASNAWAADDLAAAIFSLELVDRLVDGRSGPSAVHGALQALSTIDGETVRKRLRRLARAAPTLRAKLSIRLTRLTLSEREVDQLRRPASWACFSAHGAF